MEKQNVPLITLAMAELISGASVIRGSETATEVKPLRMFSRWFPHPPRSGSRTAAPRRTCRSWSGTGVGLRSGTCCGRRRWSSCREAGPCPGSPRCAAGWICHTLDFASNLWSLFEDERWRNILWASVLVHTLICGKANLKAIVAGSALFKSLASS